MTPEACAEAVAVPINKYGTGWMLSPDTFAPGIEAGFSGLDFYFCGRGGALGDVEADVVTAAMGVLPRDAVRTNWEQGCAVMAPTKAATLFAEACAEHGRRHLPDDVDLVELVRLATLVIDAAECAGLPLFAGWRAMPVPDDPKGAASHQLHVLREHRGGAHIAAFISSGLTPLEAVLAYGGPGTAKFLGHTEPFPDVTDEMRAARAAAEVTTNRIVAPAFAALSADERATFADLVHTALSPRS